MIPGATAPIALRTNESGQIDSFTMLHLVTLVEIDQNEAGAPIGVLHLAGGTTAEIPEAKARELIAIYLELWERTQTAGTILDPKHARLVH
jgi:hypothetical protein